MATSFKKMNSTDDNVVLILDALNLAFRWKHQGRTDFRDSYVETVKSLAKSYKCGKIIITADQGSSSYRKGLSEAYKANRKEAFKEQTEAEKQAFIDFFEEYEATLELLEEEFPLFRFDKVEADDIAAYLVKHRDAFGFDKIWLISSDRDWDLLIADNVSRFSYVTRKEVTLENWSDHYTVKPEDYISYKCLIGDPGDGVAGIAGIGPVKATNLIAQYGSAMDVYDAIPIASKYKYIQTLNNSGDIIPLNYELMDLITYCEDAIGASNCEAIKRSMLSAD
jgi:5'-3' exonuclease